MNEQYDPGAEDRWCSERQADVERYLAAEGLSHGRIGEWPAWHVAPYVSIWAIESLNRPGWVGWWAISGDLPSDYISAESIKHPREALFAFSKRWKEAGQSMAKGLRPAGGSVGSPELASTLAPLLLIRAKLFAEWAADETLWSRDAA